MMQNNLFINRLVIHTLQGKIAYDEVFHPGVNIISGDNSSGKSTITHFIFYVLGGAFNEWVVEAKKCSHVIAEVEMNGASFVLKREININETTKKGNDKEPIYIFWGRFDKVEKSSPTDWQKFSYNTTNDKKSFSNIFFENLDIPVVKGENNITFHQLLRLLYVDQDSPINSLFLYEQFDTTLTRETVSDLLLGIYNQDLYDSKQRLVDVNKELDETKRELKSLKRFFSNPADTLPENIKQKIASKEVDVSDIEESIIGLKENEKKIRFTQKQKLEFEKLNQEAIEARTYVANLEGEIIALKNEIEDSEYFILSLDKKLVAIKNSIQTRDFLDEFTLEFCPECLSEIKSNGSKTSCKLCKEPLDQSFKASRARKLEQEIRFQIKESNSLIEIRKNKLAEVSASYEAAKSNLFSVQKLVNFSIKDVKSTRDERIDSLLIEKGFAEGELLQFRTLLEQAEIYQSLSKKIDELDDESDLLKLKISSLTNEQEENRQKINRTIEKKALFLLNNDLKRQKDFIEAKEFHVDFRNNLAFISDKEIRYSASSNFYLKTTARFAIFFASLEEEKMRYPRFIMCDNMEDKGIEAGRAKNFQRIIIEEAERHDKLNYQLIYTTSFLPKDLKDSEYIVGDYYTEVNPSLKNIS